MDALPTWVSWGDAIWQVAFVLSVVLFAWWKWSQPRRAARRESRAWRLSPTRADRFEAGANSIVEGTLVATSPSVLVDGAALACIQGLSHHAVDQGAFRVEVEDQHIELEGPLELLVGSSEVRPRATFQRNDDALHARVCALPDGPLVASQLEGHHYVIRSLKNGDRVQVHGVLRRAAAQDESGYRETQGRWVLEGTGQRPLTIGSVGTPKMALAGWDRLAIGASLGGMVFVGVFIGIAALAHSLMPPTHMASADSEDLATALAATPLHRDQALESLRRIWHAEPDPDRIEQLAVLVAAQDGCQGLAMLWAEHGDYERAIELAEQCDHPSARLAAARAHYALGDMAHASVALQQVRSELDLIYSPTNGIEVSVSEHARGASRAHLARARWRTAATELRTVWRRPHDCVAEAADRRAGRSVDFGIPAESCLVLQASEESNPEALRIMVRSSVAHLRVLELDPSAKLDLTNEARAELGLPDEATCPIDPDAAPGVERAVLSKLVRQGRDPQDMPHREVVARLAARRALIEAMDGRPVQAAQYVALMERAGPIAQENELQELLSMWNSRVYRPELTDDMAEAAWSNATHDRTELLRFHARTDRGEHLIRYGHDRPVLGTFREHFCDSAARAVAAERAGMPDVAREQRAIARRFRNLMEGRRASLMLWMLDRR